MPVREENTVGASIGVGVGIRVWVNVRVMREQLPYDALHAIIVCVCVWRL